MESQLLPETEKLASPHWIEPAGPETEKQMQAQVLDRRVRVANALAVGSLAISLPVCFVLVHLQQPLRLHQFVSLASLVFSTAYVAKLVYQAWVARFQVELIEGLGDTPAVPVTVQIIQGNVVTGMDRGVIWVQDELLYFVGAYSSFSVGRKDMYRRNSSGTEITLDTPGSLTKLKWATVMSFRGRYKLNDLIEQVAYRRGSGVPLQDGPIRPRPALMAWKLSGEILWYTGALAMVLRTAPQLSMNLPLLVLIALGLSLAANLSSLQSLIAHLKRYGWRG